MTSVTPCFSLFDRVANHPKLRGQSAWVRWTWIAVLRLAEESPVPGSLLRLDRTSIRVEDVQEVAKHDHALPALESFKRVGLLIKVGNHYDVDNWQFWIGRASLEEGVGGGGVPKGKTSDSTEPSPSGHPLREVERQMALHTPLSAAQQTIAKRPKAVSAKQPEGILVELSTHKEMVDALGTMFHAQSQPEWRRCATASKILLSSTPPARTDELPSLRSAWDRLFPGTTCTELAIANRLGALRRAPDRIVSRRESASDQIRRLAER